MSPELKTKWVEALRSGKYEQGDGYLIRRDSNGVIQHCCLGVLAEVAGCKVIPAFATQTHRTQIEGYTPNDHGEYLPDDLETHLGLTFLDQEFFAGMNDENNTFAQIADEIEGYNFGHRPEKAMGSSAT